MFNALFSARGRMRRRDWWLWRIALAVVYLFSEILMHGFLGTAPFKADMDFKGLPSNGFHYWMIFLITVGQWPTICVNTKRWHDRNRPGWLAVVNAFIFSLPAFLVHFGGLTSGFGPQFAVGAAQGIFTVVAGVYAIWVLVDCGILDGTKGPNKYGPSPKGVGAQVEDVF